MSTNLDNIYMKQLSLLTRAIIIIVISLFTFQYFQISLATYISDLELSSSNVHQTRYLHVKKPPKSDPAETETCPEISKLLKVPKSCPKKPIFNAHYNSSLFPLYVPVGPGPSAQTNGFRHVILAAIYLQKSIIFSYFTKHRTDKLSKTAKIPLGLRIDIGKLCELVDLKSDHDHLVSDENYVINRTIEIFEPKHPDNASRNSLLLYIRSFTNLFKGKSTAIEKKPKYKYKFKVKSQADREKERLERDKKAEELAKRYIPLAGYSFDMLPEKENPENTTNTKSITQFFKSKNLRYNEQKIIGIGHPHIWLFNHFFKIIDEGGIYHAEKNPVYGRSEAPEYDSESARELLRSDYNLVKKLFKYTPHPEFIRNLAREFIGEYSPGEGIDIGVHWRFNNDDFLIGSYPKNMDKIVKFNNTIHPSFKSRYGISREFIREFYRTTENPVNFLEKLIKNVETHWPGITSTEQDQNLVQNRTIFIASPTSVAQKFSKIGKIFKNFKIITGLDTFKFLKAKSESCEMIDQYFGDILSTFEKEILIHVKSFYRSRPSNWSFNVQAGRFASGIDLSHDRVIFDVFK